MKQFVVLKQIGSFTPILCDSFDNEEVAQTYVKIMRDAHPDWNFKVYEMKGSAL